MYGIGCDSSEQYYRSGKHVVGYTSFAERTKETGTDLQTDAVDEENEAELLDKVRRCGIEHHTKVSAGNASKKNPCHAKRDARDFDARQKKSCSDDQGHQQNRMGNTCAHKQVINPICIHLSMIRLLSSLSFRGTKIRFSLHFSKRMLNKY